MSKNPTLEQGGPSGAHALSSVRVVNRRPIRGGVVEGHCCCDEKEDYKMRMKLRLSTGGLKVFGRVVAVFKGLDATVFIASSLHSSP